jgi:hypothetical protein
VLRWGELERDDRAKNLVVQLHLNCGLLIKNITLNGTLNVRLYLLIKKMLNIDDLLKNKCEPD